MNLMGDCPGQSAYDKFHSVATIRSHAQTKEVHHGVNMCKGRDLSSSIAIMNYIPKFASRNKGSNLMVIHIGTPITRFHHGRRITMIIVVGTTSAAETDRRFNRLTTRVAKHPYQRKETLVLNAVALNIVEIVDRMIGSVVVVMVHNDSLSCLLEPLPKILGSVILNPGNPKGTFQVPKQDLMLPQETVIVPTIQHCTSPTRDVPVRGALVVAAAVGWEQGPHM
jgi:hypothetical protein